MLARVLQTRGLVACAGLVELRQGQMMGQQLFNSQTTHGWMPAIQQRRHIAVWRGRVHLPQGLLQTRPRHAAGQHIVQNQAAIDQLLQGQGHPARQLRLRQALRGGIDRCQRIGQRRPIALPQGQHLRMDHFQTTAAKAHLTKTAQPRTL